MTSHRYPKLHNAMWPGLVGKGSPGAEPAIDLDTMLDLTAQASVDGTRFDGVDLFLFEPHVSIDASDADLSRLADKIRSKGFVVGSLVAPVWPPTGGGSAMGSEDDRRNFLTPVRKACAIGRKLRDIGVRPYGVVRIDSATGPGEWAKDPDGNTRRIAETFREACDIAAGYGERLPARGGRPARGRRRRRRRGGRGRDLLGRHAQLEAHGAAARARRSAQDDRLPGRHGAHAALHDGLQRAGGSPPARRLRLEGWRAPRRGAADGDQRTAAMDDRLPRRAER